MKCSFKGCSKDAFSKGLCGSHYAQQRVGKPLTPLQVQYHGLTESERFDRRTNKVKSGCWEWIGSTKRGYGQFRNEAGYPILAHRYALQRATGQVIDNMVVLHKCDNPLCVNPDHLFLGTQADNVADMWEKNRARPGISRGVNHGNAKLTDAVVTEIRASTESAKVVAARLGISTTTVYDLRNRKIWNHLP